MAFYRASIGGGGSSSVTNYTSKYSDNDSARSHTLSLTSGHKYLALLWNQSSATQAYNRYDGATCTGGTVTKIINLQSSNGYAQGTFYLLSATSSSVTITSSIAHRLRLFEAT